MLNKLWSTPVLQSKMDDGIKDALIQKLLVDYDIFNPPGDINKINLLEDKCKEIQDFKKTQVVPVFDEFLKLSLDKSLNDWKGYSLNGWLAGSGNDYSMRLHNHSGSQLSAVFYLMCEDLDHGGHITFTDPRHNANRGYDESFNEWFTPLIITPKSGDILVFPSYLYHQVSTYKSNLRLAIPVDIFLYTDS